MILPVTFALMSGRYLIAFLVEPQALGYDARLYANAARAMLAGGDPWAVTVNGSFAGPPTTLIPYLPFAWLRPELVAALWIVGNLVLAAYLLRRLSLPPWWLAFPPLFGVIIGGGVEIVMVALLLLGGRVAGLSVVLKPYAALPLLAQRRWRQLVLGGLVGLASLLVLPWGQFIASLPTIRDRLAFQSFGQNAFGVPLLMVVGVLALLALGRRGIWFATPVLWPYPQSYYGLMCLPVLSPLIAFCWALPIPQALLIGAGAEALVLLYQRADGPVPILGRRAVVDGGDGVSPGRAV